MAKIFLQQAKSAKKSFGELLEKKSNTVCFFDLGLLVVDTLAQKLKPMIWGHR